MEKHGASNKRGLDDEDDEEQAKRAKLEYKYNLDRYTIGWVCALTLEQTAAIAMLDEELSDVKIRRAASDTNTYTLGSIGRHNIVIACLPAGQPGVVKASKVATSMTSTFRNIKFVLMVGIGGGVPSGPTDVKLGDVVVSTPTGPYPGVVQWDFGKTKDGRFERTGALKKPPTLLLTALTKLRSHHRMRGSKIQQNLDLMFKKWPKLNRNTEDINSMPAPQERHKIPYGSNSCLYCDPKRARKRDVEEPVIHYGLIASGNQFVKDAAYREEINENLDGNVLCIEMEAAGLMDDFPCLVIRGICDYADSHKNKAWQDHAAAVAAAFTKELLEYVPSIEVDGEPTVTEKLARLQDELYNIGNTALGTQQAVMQQNDEAKEEKILNWLTSVEYGPQQSDFLSRRLRGTGQWFLDSMCYNTWLNSDCKSQDRVLFCRGPPGAGKTIITSVVIDDITSNLENDCKVGIAYLYCSFGRNKDQGLERLLSNLVKQLARRCSHFPDVLSNLYNKHRLKGTPTNPSAEELSQTLRSIADEFSKIFIIVDALDECQADNSWSALLSVIEDLPSGTSATIKLFATSRDVPEISRRFESSLTCEIWANIDDVRSYVRHQLGRLPLNITRFENLKKDIIDGVTDGVNGIFLLAKLYLESLRDTTTASEVLTALETFKKKGLSKDPTTQGASYVYDEVYTDAVERINGQPPNRRGLAMRTIAWVTHVIRPLKTTELLHALATNANDHELNLMNVGEIETITSVCAGLITVDLASDTVSLVHYTAQEYFQRKSIDYFPNAEGSITRICTAYLGFSVFDQQHLINKKFTSAQKKRMQRILLEAQQCSGHQMQQEDFYVPGWHLDMNSMESVLQLQWLDYPFIPYAAASWVHHSKQDMSASVHHIADFLSRDYHLENLLGDWLVGSVYRREHPNNGTGVHWAAYYGLVEPLEVLLKRGFQINCSDSLDNSPLFYAVSTSSEETVRRLLQYGARVDHGPKYDALLLRAAEGGSAAILAMLFELGNRMQVDLAKHYKDALKTAIHMGHLQAAEYLLTRCISVDWTDDAYKRRTPLHMATIPQNPDYPMFAMVQLLIQKGANVNVSDHRGNTPLKFAVTVQPRLSRGGWELGTRRRKRADDSLPTVELLLANGAHVEEKGALGRTPLAEAAKSNAPAIVKLLLEHGALIEAQDVYGATPLAIAVTSNALEVAELLLRKQADVNSRKHDGTTPLFDAVSSGRASLVRLLLEHGADISMRTSQQMPIAIESEGDILFHSVARSTAEIVKVLIDGGADLHSRSGERGETALIYACKLGFVDKIQVLTEAGADIHETDKSGRSALTWAKHASQVKLANLLIRGGANSKFSIPGGDHYAGTSAEGSQTPRRALSPIRGIDVEFDERDLIGAGDWVDRDQVDLICTSKNTIADESSDLLDQTLNNGFPSALILDSDDFSSWFI